MGLTYKLTALLPLFLSNLLMPDPSKSSKAATAARRLSTLKSALTEVLSALAAIPDTPIDPAIEGIITEREGAMSEHEWSPTNAIIGLIALLVRDTPSEPLFTQVVENLSKEESAEWHRVMRGRKPALVLEAGILEVDDSNDGVSDEE
jgi:hypothetical protein